MGESTDKDRQHHLASPAKLQQRVNSKSKSPIKRVKKDKDEGEGSEDFSFEVPEKLQPSDRDNTIVKKRKEEVVDVLADIKRATNFVHDLVKKETPVLNKKKSASLQI